MSHFEETRAKAAKWIRDNEDPKEAYYWEWQDLTDLNPAPDTLKLPK